MCLYTPQGLRAPKKKLKGPPSSGTKKPSQESTTKRGRSALPRNLIINQPTPVPPSQVMCPNLPRIEVVGEGERTNIYLTTPPPVQSGQTDAQSQDEGQSQEKNGQGQNGNDQERRRSSMLVQEVDRAVSIAKRLGEAVRRGSASSFGRGWEYSRRRESEIERERERERERELEHERLRELEVERERELEMLEMERAREKEREKERDRSLKRRAERQSRNRGRYRQDSSSSEESRSPSRERRSKSRSVMKGRRVREPRQVKVVDEEARHLAQYAASTAGSLMREKDIKAAAKRIAEEKGKKEERLAERVLSRYGAGGLLTPPPPPPGREFKGWSADRDRDRDWGRDWRDGVSWTQWNANAYHANYVLGPPPPPVFATAQTYDSNSGRNGTTNNSNGSGSRNGSGNGNGNGNGKRNSDGEGGRGRGNSRSQSRERRHVGSNHIHVHTAPLVQGPQISTTTTPCSADVYGEMPRIAAGSNWAGLRRASSSDPMRGAARLLETGMDARGYGMGGMRSGYRAAMPQLMSHTMGGSVPRYGTGGMGGMAGMAGMAGMNDMNGIQRKGGVRFSPTQAHEQVGARPVPVPVGEREWQRARVYNTTHNPRMGGMMY